MPILILLTWTRYYVGCDGPFFGSRGCGLGLATLPRDHWAGYRGGQLVTSPVRVSGPELRVSVDGGTGAGGAGVRVGLLGDQVRGGAALN
eukprot:COSAG01_NODE_334_length_18708_cov_49.649686_7_plen_90_part_00